jgi:HNH endonuclease/NUMOD4 motif
MLSERWIEAYGYPGYQVSSRGRVRGKRKEFLIAFMHGRYLEVNLFNNGHFTQVKVHVLVLESFIEPRPSGTYAHHKDGDKNNNNLENLEWLSAKEHGKKHRILDEKTEGEIRKLYPSMTQRKLAGKFGVSAATINRILQRR